MTRHIVARTTDIPPGGNKVVDVEGRDIVVFHVNGEFFALLNRCPHEGAPLDKAACVARLTSPEPGVYQRSRVGELLRCAWHGWEFDMRTGLLVRPEAGQGADLSGRDRGRRNAGQGALRGRDLSGPHRGQLRHHRDVRRHMCSRCPATVLPGRFENKSAIFGVRSQNYHLGVISLPGFPRR
jgi:nitrite reductase/ring-hydroxylating ferredoxin subunit